MPTPNEWDRVRDIMVSAGIENPDEFLISREQCERAREDARRVRMLQNARAEFEVERWRYQAEQAAVAAQQAALAGGYGGGLVGGLMPYIRVAQQQATPEQQAGLQAAQQAPMGYAQTPDGTWSQGPDGRLRFRPSTPEGERAKALLLRILNADQRNEYEETGWFYQCGADGRMYRVGDDRQVKVCDGDSRDRFIENWCAFVPDAPHHDTLVAQVILLRSDPERLRAQAVVTPLGLDVRDPMWRGPPRTDARMMEAAARGRDRVRTILRQGGYIICGTRNRPMGRPR